MTPIRKLTQAPDGLTDGGHEEPRGPQLRADDGRRGGRLPFDGRPLHVGVGPDGQGPRVRDLLDVLYPPKDADGRAEVRRAIEHITHPGHISDTAKIGRFFRRVGAAKLRRVRLDATGTAMWVVVTDGEVDTPPPSPTVPLDEATEAAPVRDRSVRKKQAAAEFNPEKRLTPVEETACLSTIIHYMLERDSEHKGLRVRDLVSSLYPRPEQGAERHDDVRRAIEEIARTFPGRVPDTTRLGRFFSRMDDSTVIGGLTLRRTGADSVGTTMWTGSLDANAAPPLGTVAPGASDYRPKRHYVDDTAACRKAIEKDVGIWLCDNTARFHTPPALQMEAVSGAEAAIAPLDLVHYRGCWVCVVYTRDTNHNGGRVRIPIDVWNALGAARTNGATVFLVLQRRAGTVELRPVRPPCMGPGGNALRRRDLAFLQARTADIRRMVQGGHPAHPDVARSN